MRRVERDWLRRIPGWAEVRRRPAGEPGEGEPGAAPDELGELAGLEEADDDAPSADAEAEGAEQVEPPPLEVPEDVEQARREAEERRRSNLNRNLADQAFGLEGHYLRRLATQFARMVSKVAEDSADMPAPGDEEWDLPELLRRRFTGRLVHQCRMTREKRKVALVLDTSPSCEHQARLFATIARIGEELGDCELYDAPNFAIMARKLGDRWERLPEPERAWSFRNRVVVAFGDFDGLERIAAASAVRGNRIYWFCCEVRPLVLQQERERFVRTYKGHYHAATNVIQLMRAMRRVR